MLRILLVLFLTVLAPPPGRCDTAPFKVGIAIDADSLNAAAYKTRGVFFVKTTIKNISSSDRIITVWTQHGWSWLSSSPDVTPGIEALQNISSRGTLHPGEAYESSVEMWIDPRGKRRVTFRLGFYPDATRPVSKMKGADLSKAVSWSNEVTLDR
jgi:hypothetical protein